MWRGVTGPTALSGLLALACLGECFRRENKQKKGVRAYLQDHGRAVSASTDLAAFLKMLDKFRSLDKITDINRAIIHEELVERAKEKEAKEAITSRVRSITRRR